MGSVAAISPFSKRVQPLCMLFDVELKMHTSCFMNMINYYLLKGQSEFLHVKQKQLPCLSKFLCVRFGS